MLACFNASITIVESFDWREGVLSSKTYTVPEFMKANLSENALLTSIEMRIPTAGQLTIGKVTPRPTMSAGYITYAFCTENESASYFYNNGNGLMQISAPISFTPEGFNTSLAAVEDISVRAQLLKHYSQLQNLPIEPLNFDQIRQGFKLKPILIDDRLKPAIKAITLMTHLSQTKQKMFHNNMPFNLPKDQLVSHLMFLLKLANFILLLLKRNRLGIL